MADERDSILAQYGAGYVPPQLQQGDGETLDTQGILNQYSAQNTGGIPGWMRGLAERIKGWTSPPQTAPVSTLTGRERNLETRTQHNVPLLAETVGVHMPAGALETAANWLDWTPRVGPDTLAPLGLAGMMVPGAAVAGSVGVFGGRLARTADREALSRAEEMAARGAPRDDIWSQTGWFQGRDGQWRFEIDDSAARLEPWMTRRADDTAGVPIHSTVGEGFRHPDLAAAYPSLGDAQLTLTRNPFEPQGSGSYGQGHVHVSGPDPAVQRSVMLHELQHAIQEHEGFARGSNTRAVRETPEWRQATENWGARPTDEHDWTSVGTADRTQAENMLAMDLYRRTAGETEARNVQARRDFSPEARRAIPPWRSQDVDDADQILRQYSAEPQMSSSLPMDEAARLARAREMGFDPDQVWYHGSPETFDAFRRDRADVNEISGNYFTPSRSEAASYGPNVGAYYLGTQRPIRLMVDHESGWRAMDEGDASRLAKAGVDLGELDANRLTRALERLGYDAAEQWDMVNGKPQRMWRTVFDPSNIRRTDAAFDPAQRSSPNLLAADTARSSLPGVVASGAEGAARAEADRILQQYTKGPSEVERPVEAAIRVDGQVFSGPNHGIAYERASEGLGRKITSGAAVDGGGFITNQGRYVTREEAQSLARRADMTPSRGSQFDSENLPPQQATRTKE